MNENRKKLHLNRETIRLLSSRDLLLARGGGGTGKCTGHTDPIDPHCNTETCPASPATCDPADCIRYDTETCDCTA